MNSLHQCHVPIASSIPLERGALGIALHGLRLADADSPHVGNIHRPISNRHTLRNTEPWRIGLPALEARKPGAFLEEVHIGAMPIGQDLLQGLRVGFAQPRGFRQPLQRRQSARQLRLRQTFTGFHVVCPALRQRPLPGEAASARQANERLTCSAVGRMRNWKTLRSFTVGSASGSRCIAG